MLRPFLVTTLFLAATGCSHLASHESAITYACDSGERPVVSYSSPESTFLEYRGEKHHLQRARSASGARYADERIVWWIKGSEASLFAVERDGSTGERLERCHVANGK